MLLNKCVTCHDASGLLIAALSKYTSFTTQSILMPVVCLDFSCCRYGGVYRSTVADKGISNLALPMLILHTGNNSYSQVYPYMSKAVLVH